MKPITFFIPAYNCAATVMESIDSIMQSNFMPDDELIIANDCSTDNTKKVLESAQLKYPEIRVIHQKRNKGGASTRNLAIEEAKNDILFCLDSDNVLEVNSVSKLREVQEASGADIVCFGSVKYFKENIKSLSHEWHYKQREIDIHFCLSNIQIPPASGNYLFTKNSWIKANGYPEFSGALDTWGFGIRQLFNNDKMLTVKGTYYFHRVGTESYWVRDSRNNSISLKALQILIPFFPLIENESIDYLMSKKHRNSWFDSIEKRPIRVNFNKSHNEGTFNKLKGKIFGK
jgi:glycosyltransferase involved in cell wall biosynthesis